MKMQAAPRWVHVFVCVNDRRGEKPSCADKEAVAIHARLKAISKERGWAGKAVRVSKSGCLGLCAHGPNVLIHPQGLHFSEVTPDDLPAIEEIIAQAVSELNGQPR